MRGIVLGSVALASVASSASGQTAPSSLYILTDVTDASHAERCGYSAAAIIAALRSAMRYNRIKESHDAYTPRVYVATNEHFNPLTRICTVSYRLQIFDYTYAKLPGLEGQIYAKTVFCDRSGMVGDQYPNIPPRIRAFFDQCLSEIEDSVA